MTRIRSKFALAALSAFLIALPALAVSGTAQAASAPAHAGAGQATLDAVAGQAAPGVEFHCSGLIFTAFRTCYFQTEGGRAPLFAPNGSRRALLPLYDKVLVTCFYYGNPPKPYAGDGIEDHVTWENTIGNFTGHIPDSYIAEGDKTPSQYPYDLSQC